MQKSGPEGQVPVDFPEGVHKLASTRGAYAYLVEGRDPDGGPGSPRLSVLIDTGFPGRAARILVELESLGVKHLDHIVVTHGDVDHTGNLERMMRETGARAWIPAGERPYIMGVKPRPGIKRLVGALVRVAVPDSVDDLSDGDRVGPLEALATPGHTPGHLAFRGLGFLAVGDALTVRNGRMVPSSGLMAWNAQLARESAEHLLAGFYGWILPAHGEPARYDG